MATGRDVVNAALATFKIQGIHYDQCGSRCHPNQYPHCVDCSGLTSYVLNAVGIPHECDGSFFQSRAVHAGHGGLSIDQALNTPGAFLFQGVNEGQGGIPGKDPGHVGISAGDGVHSLEARGHWSGVGVFVARSLVWQYAGMYPGVNATTIPTPKPPTQPPLPPIANQEINMSMVALPPSGTTKTGRVATARAVKEYNFVLLEDGARLKGDVAIDGQRHWWAPVASAHVAGWQILDVADMRPLNGTKALAVRYGYPNGDSGTYIAEMV